MDTNQPTPTARIADAARQLHTIVGSGAVGSGTALELADAGHRVRVVTRSGTGPSHPNIELVAADASDTSRLTEAARGAHALYNCANPPYSAWTATWPALAASFISTAEATGARLVTMSNLYGFAKGASPMAATDPLDPPSIKGKVRADMWTDALAAHDAGRIRTTELRASDYVGPGVGATAHFGDRVVPRALNGKSVSFVGAVDVAHSWSYIGDVCRTLATLGTDDRALGRAWHVPSVAPMTATELTHRLCATAGVDDVTVKRMPRAALRLAGVFVPLIREMNEVLYQFDEPFVIDATDTTETFGITATPIDDQLWATIDSYRPATSAAAA